jgi:hypothetical protein
MDKFEKMLADLPLAKPSSDLRQRIFGGMAEPVAERRWFRDILRHGVPLAWAASIAIIAGLAGAMLVSRPGQTEKPMMMVSAEQTVTVQLEADKNVFDFTSQKVESIYDDVDVDVSVDEEA